MNPIFTPTNGHVVVGLTDKDLRYLSRVRLMEGSAEAESIAGHEMCIMQAVTALTTPNLDIPALAKKFKRVNRRLDQLIAKYGATPQWSAEWSKGDREEYDKLRQEMAEVEDDIHLSDSPICVSQEIAAAMQCINDRRLTARQRGRLKSLVGRILNTSPIKQKVRTYKTKPPVIEETRDRHDKEYMNAERQRKAILRPIIHSGHSEEAPLGEAIKLIEQAADVYRVEAPAA